MSPVNFPLTMSPLTISPWQCPPNNVPPTISNPEHPPLQDYQQKTWHSSSLEGVATFHLTSFVASSPLSTVSDAVRRGWSSSRDGFGGLLRIWHRRNASNSFTLLQVNLYVVGWLSLYIVFVAHLRKCKYMIGLTPVSRRSMPSTNPSKLCALLNFWFEYRTNSYHWISSRLNCIIIIDILIRTLFSHSYFITTIFSRKFQPSSPRIS